MLKYLFIILLFYPLLLSGQNTLNVECYLIASGAELSETSILKNYSSIGEPIVGFATNLSDSMEIGFIPKSDIINSIDKVLLFINPKIKVYPNPFSDRLKLESESVDTYRYSIWDLAGKEIKSEKIYGHEISVLDISRGTYLLHIYNKKDQLISVFKLIRL